MDSERTMCLFVICADITDTCANYHDVTYSFVSLLSCTCVERPVLKAFFTKHVLQEGAF